MSCDCCNRDLPTQVAASPIGPASFAYCRECFDSRAEPEGTIIYLWEDVAGKDWASIRVDILEETSVYKEGKYLTLREWSAQHESAISPAPASE